MVGVSKRIVALEVRRPRQHKFVVVKVYGATDRNKSLMASRELLRVGLSWQLDHYRVALVGKSRIVTINVQTQVVALT